MTNRPLRVLMYHRIVEPGAAPTCNPSVVSATPAAFAEQMRLVAAHYRVLSVEEVIDSLRSRRPLPRRALLITFDDGCRDFGEVAWPILRRYHLPAIVFVPTAFPGCPGRSFWWDRLYCAFHTTPVRGGLPAPFDRLDLATGQSRRAALRTIEQIIKTMPHADAMGVVETLCGLLGERVAPPSDVLSWEEMRALAADGAVIGAHTRTHPALTQLAPEQASSEIRRSREDVQREIGCVPPIFAYPFGDFDERVAALVRNEGFEMALTCRDGQTRPVGAEAFRCRRTNITPRTTTFIFRARLTLAGSYADRWRHARRDKPASLGLPAPASVAIRAAAAAAPGNGAAGEEASATARASSVQSVANAAAGDEASASAASATRFLRGSSLLLVGRFISVLLNFGVQVLAVRYLSKTDYGAFAYGIGVAALGASVVLMGLGRGIPRLIAIYEERGDHARTFGSLALAAAAIWGVGLTLVAGLFAFQGLVARTGHLDPTSLSVLLVLVSLAPIDAFDNILHNLAAIFCSPRTIFFRRQVLTPAMRLTAVLLVRLMSGSVYLLAYGYVLGGLIGISVYLVILLREWRRRGLLRYLRPGRFVLPVREVFGFSLPMLSTDLAVVATGSLAVVMLEYFRTAGSVAEFRAVVPVANLNAVVFEAFAFLFVPVASRMFARNDHRAISDLYWRTSLWIVVLTLPVFLATTLLAPVITVLLFGPRYAGAAGLLAILAIGQYFNAALGFNADTLRVHGKVRMLVIADLLTVAFSIGLSLVLISRYGAPGAAWTVTATLVFANLLHQANLRLGDTGVRLVAWPVVRVYLFIVAATASLIGSSWLLHPPAALTALAAAVVAVVVFRLSRHTLQPGTTFPELLRIPILARLVS